MSPPTATQDDSSESERLRNGSVRRRLIAVLPYAITVFSSAFLLFQIQPIIAKMILPWFGGSAEVWTICLLFFQVGLLLGYSYAHLSVRLLAPRWQGPVHAGLLACSLLFLPVIPNAVWKPSGAEEPAARILGLLAATIGLPYVVLSATSPLLQAWYAGRRAGIIPYRLFAVSNLASLLALISYPILVEPRIPTRSQASAWSILYIVFALVCGAVAIASRSTRTFTGSPPESGPRPAWRRQVLWLSLAACASTLLLAVTNHLTQNVAAIPFLWVAPLALYLLSFILCFESPRWYQRRVWLPLTGAAIACMAFALRGDRQILPLEASLPLFCGGLFACCMTMHGELARAKPEPRHLTSFYLVCSLGGALGGLFVGLVAPHLFSRYSELPIAMVWCAFLIHVVLDLDPPGRFKTSRANPLWAVSLSGMVVLAFYLAPGEFESGRRSRLNLRNFYGVLQVTESGGARQLINGIITHGEQFLDPAMRTSPTTYYGETSGVGLALRETESIPSRRVGLIGLGIGTLATYARPGDYFRFYEVNPLVIQVADTQFTYLRDSRGKIDVVLGDARLSMEREPLEKFDVLVVDAFTGDSIPVHLLTREAFALYFRHLKGSGVLAVHVSNLHLDLTPVVKLASDAFGKPAVLIESPGDKERRVYLASWVLAGNREILDRPPIRTAAAAIRPRDRMRLWTDDYNNLFQVLR